MRDLPIPAVPSGIEQAGIEQEKRTDLSAIASIGALMGGLMASTCCLLPLVLVSIGVGGAWMSNLTALAPYQPFFLGLAAVSVGGGFWLSRRARRQACVIDGPCAKTIGQKRYRISLWLGGALAVIAIAINGLAPFLY